VREVAVGVAVNNGPGSRPHPLASYRVAVAPRYRSLWPVVCGATSCAVVRAVLVYHTISRIGGCCAASTRIVGPTANVMRGTSDCGKQILVIGKRSCRRVSLVRVRAVLCGGAGM
jgi:hypothetical protein